MPHDSSRGMQMPHDSSRANIPTFTACVNTCDLLELDVDIMYTCTDAHVTCTCHAQVPSLQERHSAGFQSTCAAFHVRTCM